MSVAKYFPFNGDRGRLRLGLRPIEISDWIHYEDDFPLRIREKKRLYATKRKRVLDALIESLGAQQELLNILIAYLKHNHANKFKFKNKQIISLAENETYTVSKYDQCPLELVSYLVADDFCLLEKDQKDYRLVAASVCAPTWWELSEKIGMPLTTIHSPIEGLEEKIGRSIRHFLQNLKVGECYQRSNWFLVNQPNFCIFPSTFNMEQMEQDLVRINSDNIEEKLYLRCERQTFRKLEKSRNVAFSIKVYVSPISIVKKHTAIARDLVIAMNTMVPDQKQALGINIVEKPLRNYLQRII